MRDLSEFFFLGKSGLSRGARTGDRSDRQAEKRNTLRYLTWPSFPADVAEVLPFHPCGKLRGVLATVRKNYDFSRRPLRRLWLRQRHLGAKRTRDDLAGFLKSAAVIAQRRGDAPLTSIYDPLRYLTCPSFPCSSAKRCYSHGQSDGFEPTTC